MNLLSRWKEIMASNIHAILDRSEDPEKVIHDWRRKLSSDLRQVQAEMAALSAHERRARRLRDECQDEIDQLRRYAERAAASGNDREALKFLQMKAEQAEKLPSLQQAWETAASHVSNMKRIQEKLASELRQLEERYARLKGKMECAKMQQRMNAMGSAVSGADAAFEAWEEQVQREYDEAMALAELRKEPEDDLDRCFAPLEDEAKRLTPEQELAALKRKLKEEK
jgi:phage shock protein A